jgi:hypothetical protein
MQLSTTTSLALVDGRNAYASIQLPATTGIYGRSITVKDAYGVAGISTISVLAQGSDFFETGTQGYAINADYGFRTFVAGSNKWFVTNTSQLTPSSILLYNEADIDMLTISSLASGSAAPIQVTSDIYSFSTICTAKMVVYDSNTFVNVGSLLTSSILTSSITAATSLGLVDQVTGATLPFSSSNSALYFNGSAVGGGGGGDSLTVSTITFAENAIDENIPQFYNIIGQNFAFGLSSLFYSVSSFIFALPSKNVFLASEVNGVAGITVEASTASFSVDSDITFTSVENIKFRANCNISFESENTIQPLIYMSSLNVSSINRAAPITAGASNTQLIAYSGSVQTITLPPTATRVKIEAVGASGGGPLGGADGGKGAVVTGIYTIPNSSTQLSIAIGGQGGQYQVGGGSGAGFNGGGVPDNAGAGGGGGGATSVYVVGSGSFLLVAGGGGGSGGGLNSTAGGDAGGIQGGNGVNYGGGGANGGEGANGITPGNGGVGDSSNGIIGTASAGTSIGVGGAGAVTDGGAGGGGYAGGGGGAQGGSPDNAAAGGGAGSSYVDAGLAGVSYATAATGGNGYIRLTYYYDGASISTSILGLPPIITSSISFATDSGLMPLTVSNSNLYLNGTAIGAQIVSGWSTYTVNWTAATTDPVLGDGSLNGRFKQIGKTTHVNIKLTAGTTTTFGNGHWRFSLPVSTFNADSAILPTTFLDNGTAWYQGNSWTSYDGDTGYVVPVWDKGTTGNAPADSATPFTWTDADSLTISGSYESI